MKVRCFYLGTWKHKITDYNLFYYGGWVWSAIGSAIHMADVLSLWMFEVH